MRRKHELIIPSATSHLPEKTRREARQEIDRVKAGLTVIRAHDKARVRRVSGLTEDVQVSATLLSARQGLLQQLVPGAAPYLHLVTQTGVMGMTKVLQDVAED